MTTAIRYQHATGFVAGDRPKIVTSRFEHADSFTLERFLATGGYAGLRKALGRAATDVHEEVKSATVLGRGGAGFPAGTKWGLTPQQVFPKYLVVNGDESEPGTYKDRLLMERDPHQLIEGCLIACYAAGLSQCFLYIRGEMALAQERVAGALNEAYAAGYVGKNILGSKFSVDIVLHWGAGAQAAVFSRSKWFVRPANNRQQRRDSCQLALVDGQRLRGVHRDWHQDFSWNTHGCSVGARQKSGSIRNHQRHDNV
jgi:NADH-quinone oxidoreductase subunit F